MAQKYAKDGLIVLAVNHWDEDKETLTKYVAENKLQQRVLLNGSSVGRELYEVSGIPICFWINRSGVIVDSHVDFEGPEVLDQKTKKLIAGQ
jgi:hypothetical protein